MRGGLRGRRAVCDSVLLLSVGARDRDLLAPVHAVKRTRETGFLAAACAFCVLMASARPAKAQAMASEPAPESFQVKWQNVEPVSPGYARTTHSRKGLVIAGAVLFGSLYAVNLTGVAGNAVFGRARQENWLALPGVGPLVVMAQTTNAPGNLLLAADALVQLSAIAMFVYGLAAQVPAIARDEGAPSLAVMPMLGGGRAGVGVVGRF
jgi:hypothetical protein